MMTIGWASQLIYSAALIGAPVAPAPDASPADDQSIIVVTGERDREKSIRDFVGALTHISPLKQLGRFEQSVCPIAFGLPPRQAKAVADRIRRVGREVGVTVGGAGCYPNVVVMVTHDKNVFMQELRRRYPNYFGDLPQSEVRKLVRQPGPAVAWQLQGTAVNARGVELYFDPRLELYTNRTTQPGSRIQAATRPQFAAAFVVVERRALAGLSATQLADYAAMRAFAGADPARLASSGAPTILRVLEAPMGTEVPLTMTRWDLSFLRGYYSSPRTLSNNAQRSAIRESVDRELEVTRDK